MFNKIRCTALQVETKPVFAWLALSLLTLSTVILSNMPGGGGGGS
jgi:hypothetical protein